MKRHDMWGTNSIRKYCRFSTDSSDCEDDEKNTSLNFIHNVENKTDARKPVAPSVPRSHDLPVGHTSFSNRPEISKSPALLPTPVATPSTCHPKPGLLPTPGRQLTVNSEAIASHVHHPNSNPTSLTYQQLSKDWKTMKSDLKDKNRHINKGDSSGSEMDVSPMETSPTTSRYSTNLDEFLLSDSASIKTSEAEELSVHSLPVVFTTDTVSDSSSCKKIADAKKNMQCSGLIDRKRYQSGTGYDDILKLASENEKKRQRRHSRDSNDSHKNDTVNHRARHQSSGKKRSHESSSRKLPHSDMCPKTCGRSEQLIIPPEIKRQLKRKKLKICLTKLDASSWTVIITEEQEIVAKDDDTDNSHVQDKTEERTSLFQSFSNSQHHQPKIAEEEIMDTTHTNNNRDVSTVDERCKIPETVDSARMSTDSSSGEDRDDVGLFDRLRSSSVDISPSKTQDKTSTDSSRNNSPKKNIPRKPINLNLLKEKLSASSFILKKREDAASTSTASSAKLGSIRTDNKEIVQVCDMDAVINDVIDDALNDYISSNGVARDCSVVDSVVSKSQSNNHDCIIQESSVLLIKPPVSNKPIKPPDSDQETKHTKDRFADDEKENDKVTDEEENNKVADDKEENDKVVDEEKENVKATDEEKKNDKVDDEEKENDKVDDEEKKNVKVADEEEDMCQLSSSDEEDDLPSICLGKAVNRSEQNTQEKEVSFSQDSLNDSLFDNSINELDKHPPVPKCFKLSLDTMLRHKKDNDKKEAELSEIKKELQQDVATGWMNKVSLDDSSADDILPDHKKQLDKYSFPTDHVPDIYPGETVFNLDHLGEIFSFPSTLRLADCGFMPIKGKATDSLLWKASPDDLVGLINSCLLVEAHLVRPCQDALMVWMFYLMSIHGSIHTIMQAFRTIWSLMNNSIKFNQGRIWLPTLKQITRVLLNYGASFESMFPFPDLEPVFSLNDVINESGKGKENMVEEGTENSAKNPSSAPKKQFPVVGLNHVIKVITHGMNLRDMHKQPVFYTEDELKQLIGMISRAGLETQGREDTHGEDLMVCTSTLIDAFSRTSWPFKCKELCQALPALTTHHHNLVHLVDLFPTFTDRGRSIRRLLSYYALHKLLSEDDTAVSVEIEKENLTSEQLKVCHLFPALRSLHPTFETDYYRLHSIITLTDTCVGNEPLPTKEKDDLYKLIKELRNISRVIRASPHYPSRSKVKHILQRISIKFNIMADNMVTKQFDVSKYDGSNIMETPVEHLIDSKDECVSDAESTDDDIIDDDIIEVKEIESHVSISSDEDN